MEYITMSSKELKQVKIFEQVKSGTISQAEAAARLRVTPRWVRSKIKRYYENGDIGLVHRSRGKISLRRWNKEEEDLLVKLLQGEWRDFGPTFATEKLEEVYQVKVSREVVRKSMIAANLWQPKQNRSKHRKRRERKPMLGMMVQLDGSPHDWFEGRAGKCTLLVYIDDATSKILWLEFAESESVESLMKGTKGYIQVNGIPQSFYVDHGSTFHVNLNNAEGEKKTQWERVCKQLNIAIIHANSPQAKGRVERCNATMQDRLIKEMRLAGISSIESANQYLRDGNFIEKHNAKFAVSACQDGDAHADASGYDLSDIFSIMESRVLANDFTIQYTKRIFQLHKQQKTIVRPKDHIVVKTSLEGTISLWIRKTKLNFHEIREKMKQLAPEKKVFDRIYKPSENSRRWVSGLAPVTTQESWMKSASTAVESL